MKNLRSLALIIAAFAFPMTSVEAATCPDPFVSGVTGVITVDTASGCHSTGDGGVNLAPLVLLDKTTDGTGVFDGALTMTESSEQEGRGTFSISATPGYANLVMVVKDGQLSDDFQWGAFNIAVLSSGNWSIKDINDKYKGLSGGELWGSVSAVPVPAAVWLFGTALFGFIGMSRRTKV